MKTLGDFKKGDIVQLRKNGAWYTVLYFQGMDDHICYIQSTLKTRQRNYQMNYRHKHLEISTPVFSYGIANYIDDSVYPGAKNQYGNTLQRLAE